jgi:cation diffusion facilitator CzcD-associated flavoprotein CzcO
LVDKYDLRSRLVFNTAFTGSWWNETEQLHDIELQRIDGTKYRVKAHLLVSAAGPLNTPRYPNVPGRETFKGTQFHSSHWDPKLELEDRRFAVIGSGSTAVQLIPGLASMKGVTVTQFMRSPGWYFPKVCASVESHAYFC